MKSFLFSILFALTLIAPFPAFAATANFFGPIISPECNCENQSGAGGSAIATAPDYGCVLQTVQNVISLTITIGVFIAVIAIVITSFQFMTSVTNPEAKNKARGRLVSVLVGMLLVLSAWLIVDFVMKSLYNPAAGDGLVEFGPWNTILNGEEGTYCIQVAETPPPLPTLTVANPTAGVPNPTGTTGSSGYTGASGCPSCVSLSELGLSCKNSASCTLDANVAPKIVALKNSFSGTWTVTEAYPPTARHTNACHRLGTCIDAGFRGSTSYNGTNISAFAQAASSAGLRAVFETADCSLRDAARAAGVTAYCKTDSGYGHITGSHFSVYNR